MRIEDDVTMFEAGQGLACRVLNRRVEAHDGLEEFRALVASAAGECIEVSLDADITPGDLLSVRTGDGGWTRDARVAWVRKNAMPILGRFTAGLALLAGELAQGAGEGGRKP